MMDWSSVIDAGLALMGGIAVLAMGLWTLSNESSTVSTSVHSLAEQSRYGEYSPRKAA